MAGKVKTTIVRLGMGAIDDAAKGARAARPFRAAATLYKGRIYEGFSHPEIYEKYPYINLDEAEQGFVTQSGKFVTRDEASWMVGSPDPLEAATAHELGLIGDDSAPGHGIKAGDVLTPKRRNIGTNALDDISAMMGYFKDNPSAITQMALSPAGSMVTDLARARLQEPDASEGRVAMNALTSSGMVENMPGWSKAGAAAVKTGTDLIKLSTGALPMQDIPKVMGQNLQKLGSGVKQGFGDNPVMSILAMLGPFGSVMSNAMAKKTLNIDDKSNVKTTFMTDKDTIPIESEFVPFARDVGEDPKQVGLTISRNEVTGDLRAKTAWISSYKDNPEATIMDLNNAADAMPSELSKIPIIVGVPGLRKLIARHGGVDQTTIGGTPGPMLPALWWIKKNYPELNLNQNTFWNRDEVTPQDVPYALGRYYPDTKGIGLSTSGLYNSSAGSPNTHWVPVPLMMHEILHSRDPLWNVDLGVPKTTMGFKGLSELRARAGEAQLSGYPMYTPLPRQRNEHGDWMKGRSKVYGQRFMPYYSSDDAGLAAQRDFNSEVFAEFDRALMNKELELVKRKTLTPKGHSVWDVYFPGLPTK